MILCDIGNTTYHFKTKNKDFKILVKDNIKKIKELNKKDKIYFISVNEKAAKKLLKYYPNAFNLENILKFQTKYKGMGIDRKVVCKRIDNGIIIDAGSAITVDIMKNKKHKGGYILPGLKFYSEIYPQISKKLQFDFKNDINLDKIPLKTNIAINYAMFDSIVQSIKKQYLNFDLPLYFTGGDGEIIMKYFKNIPKKYDKDLIFKGMLMIIKNNKKENRC